MMEIPDFGDKLYEAPYICPHKKIAANVEIVYAAERPVRLQDRVHFYRLGENKGRQRKPCPDCRRSDCVCLWTKNNVLTESENIATSIVDAGQSYSKKPNKLSHTVNPAKLHGFYHSAPSRCQNAMTWIKRPISELRMSTTDVQAMRHPAMPEKFTYSENDKYKVEAKKNLYAFKANRKLMLCNGTVHFDKITETIETKGVQLLHNNRSNAMRSDSKKKAKGTTKPIKRKANADVQEAPLHCTCNTKYNSKNIMRWIKQPIGQLRESKTNVIETKPPVFSVPLLRLPFLRFSESDECISKAAKNRFTLKKKIHKKEEIPKYCLVKTFSETSRKLRQNRVHNPIKSKLKRSQPATKAVDMDKAKQTVRFLNATNAAKSKQAMENVKQRKQLQSETVHKSKNKHGNVIQTSVEGQRKQQTAKQQGTRNAVLLKEHVRRELSVISVSTANQSAAIKVKRVNKAAAGPSSKAKHKGRARKH